MVDSIIKTGAADKILLCYILLLLGLKEESEILRGWQFIKYWGLLWMQKVFHHTSSGDYLWLRLKYLPHPETKVGWASSSETTRATHCFWILLRIFVQWNPTREEKTFNLLPTSRKHVRSQVGLGDRKRNWCDLLGTEHYTAERWLSTGLLVWVHAILNSKGDTGWGLAFRCLIVFEFEAF